MDKIVILKDEVDSAPYLVPLLSRIFPEWEVQVVRECTGNDEDIENAQRAHPQQAC